MTVQRPIDRPTPAWLTDQAAENAGSLIAAWTYSRQRLQTIRRLLQSLPAPIACVAVSGSLCRMEAHPGSDLDLLVVVDDRQHEITESQAADLYQAVWQQLKASPELADLKAPKPGGVFSSCASWKKLTDLSVRGMVNEDMTTYGQRMQLLLDAQPLAGDDQFAELQHNILHWFSETRIAELFHEAGPFHWLILEVQRYWTSIQARACWIHHNEPAKSLEINVKLRSSRLVLFTAFLETVSNVQRHCSNRNDLVHEVQHALRQTPLERLGGEVVMPSRVSQGLLQSYAFVNAWLASFQRESAEVPIELGQALQDLRRCVEMTEVV